MANYFTLITQAGLAKITNAQLTSSKVEITEVVVGDGNGTNYSPTGTETQLKRVVWRGGVTSLEIDAQNPNWIVAEAIIPATVGGFTIREVGLYDVDGTLIAIGNYPDTYKPVLADGSTMDLALRTIIEVNNADSVTLKIDPNVVVASRAYVDAQVAKQLAQKVDWISPTAFGADESGTADSTQAIKAALDYAARNAVKKVRLPAGTFKVNPNQLIVPENVTLEGSTYRDTIIINGDRTGIVGFGVRLSLGTTLQNLYVRGFEIGVENYGYWTKIYDCKLSYNVIGATFQKDSYIVKCKNNEITFNKIGVLVGRETYQLLIKDNIIDNNSLGVGLQGNSIGCIIEGNTIEGNRNTTTGNGCAVLICGINFSRTDIRGNWFEANGTTDSSADVILSPYYTNVSVDAVGVDIYNTIIDDCVPPAYQALFRNIGIDVGTINLTNNAHIFTKYGILLGVGERLTVNVEKNYFKGILNKYNKHIYLSSNRNNNVINISGNNARNSDNGTIDSQVRSGGVRNTIVHAYRTLTSSVTLDGLPLFTLTTTFDELLKNCTVKEVTLSANAGEITNNGILDKRYFGKSSRTENAELVEIGNTSNPILNKDNTDDYYILLADKNAEYRLQYTTSWTNTKLENHDRFPVKLNGNLVSGRIYMNAGGVTYLVLIISKAQYDQIFNMVADVHITDLQTQLIGAV